VVQTGGFYSLKPLAEAAHDSAIFIAPQGLPGTPSGTWSGASNVDHILFDDILAFAKANLCLDSTRVFAAGFSTGAMVTYSLSTNHQQQIRAAVGIAPANYNIWLPNPLPTAPIAWMQTTGMSDATCRWIQNDSLGLGAKFIALKRGLDNGCTVPASIPTWQSGNHICYDFSGCTPEYPVKTCTFNGGHVDINKDPGATANWIAEESWKFFTQF
jgi:poly(3-hydroxybutyrate) depolymerase